MKLFFFGNDKKLENQKYQSFLIAYYLPIILTRWYINNKQFTCLRKCRCMIDLHSIHGHFWFHLQDSNCIFGFFGWGTVLSSFLFVHCSTKVGHQHQILSFSHPLGLGNCIFPNTTYLKKIIVPVHTGSFGRFSLSLALPRDFYYTTYDFFNWNSFI